VHFAITSEQERLLLAADDEGDRDAVDELLEDIEELWDDDALKVDTDKAWDTIHRCLTDGTLEPEGGEYPLSYAILGGRHLHDEYYGGGRPARRGSLGPRPTRRGRPCPLELQGWIRVLHELSELGREPGAFGRRAGECAGGRTSAWRRSDVVGVAHAVEGFVGDGLAGAVRYTRRFDPRVGVDPLGGRGGGPLTQTGAGLVAVVAFDNAPVDPGLVDENVHVR